MAVEALCAALAGFSPTRVLSSPLSFFFLSTPIMHPAQMQTRQKLVNPVWNVDPRSGFRCTPTGKNTE